MTTKKEKNNNVEATELTNDMLLSTDYKVHMSNTVRVRKHERQRAETTIEINRGIVGDSIEVMIERIRDGDGEASIEDRDLVYNDNEVDTVNPLTNIRSDKMELLLEQKMGEYEHKQRPTMKVVKEENEQEEKTDKTEGGESKTGD